MAPAPADALSLRVVDRIARIDRAAWNACAGTANPFLQHGFLAALEDSGSATAATGWTPQHLLAENAAGQLVAAMPLYLKSHSQGEYVFDHGWAQAFERAGGRYYPKLLSAVPFTPVTGPRFLVRPDQPRAALVDLLIAGAAELARQAGVSSLHITFPTADEWQQTGGHGFLQRTGEQFHWHNPGYGTFDDFLAALNARKRKMIRRERQEAQQAGIEIVTLTGAELDETHWDAFFDFYMDTGSRKWGRPYLNRNFFARLHAAMPENVVLVMARRGRRWIAGALNLQGNDTLYGRYWGATEPQAFLHFECCYYRAIDYAIARGLARVEAGAQGEHKIARGYAPVSTYSAHWIADPGFRAAVARYLAAERSQIAEDIEYQSHFLPFRKTDIATGD